MDTSEQNVIKRFAELAIKSDRNSQYLFTDFLSLAEQDLLHRAMKDFPDGSYELNGGMEGAERVMARFGSPEQFGYETDYPITCIKIRPLLEKFAENLTHRDYLGALMNLGIERGLLGDIVIREKTAFLFCEEHMADYITQSLEKIRHTNVKCECTEEVPEEVQLRLKEEELIVSAQRADGIVAKVYSLSRSQSLALFRGQKIFVNGRVFENNSAELKSGSVISVRGYGKFRYDGLIQETKKGRCRVKIARYV
ncbi:MAG: hypothetical protein E7294_04850 [Lachnospiraceae bacterium]|jgi:RNA-binding protein YlmH|nr:hypothetical protein [Lachnospiraceae bacterium]